MVRPSVCLTFSEIGLMKRSSWSCEALISSVISESAWSSNLGALTRVKPVLPEPVAGILIWGPRTSCFNDFWDMKVCCGGDGLRLLDPVWLGWTDSWLNLWATRLLCRRLLPGRAVMKRCCEAVIYCCDSEIAYCGTFAVSICIISSSAASLSSSISTSSSLISYKTVFSALPRAAC